LDDFKPLQTVVLPDLGAIQSAGLVVLIGPNSSGKTQLLRDLEGRLAGVPRNLVVAERISIQKPALNPLLERLEAEGYVKRTTDGSSRAILRPQTTYIGSSQPAPDIFTEQVEGWLNEFPPSGVPTSQQPVNFLNYFGRMMTTALFLDRRLVALGTVNGFDRNTQPPQGDLHVLYYHETAQDDLWNETTRVFGKAVWLDPTKPNLLRLLVADEPYPTDKQRRSPAEMDRHREIATEGDGLKSYVATCIALLLGRRPVCLIDEPELCLHPPQAYSLGQFIGRFGASSERATFVATHSSHVLRGVIQSGEKVQIVRLTREAGKFHAHFVPEDVLKETLKKPALRAETILDGVFSQGVAIVEADGDRAVYQAAWETLASEQRFDIHFAPVGGSGGILDACNLYKRLQIPTVVIVDLDIINDPVRLKGIAMALSDKDKATEIVQALTPIIADIKKLSPEISVEEVKRIAAEVASTQMDWQKDDDVPVQRRLLALARSLDRVRRLKRGGLLALPEHIKEPLAKVLASAEAIGLFIVPVGELEGWVAHANVKASKQDKWAWASEAATRIRELGAQNGDVWDFMRRIARHLS
jgi:hypothetical protein